MAPVNRQNANKPPKKKQSSNEENKSVISGQLQKKIDSKQKKPQKDPKGIVFIKHLPHGFFEDQLKKYFEQFGNVTRVRLARSRRTGNSKGYAFVEFEYPEVAEVAAETMDNYLMFKQIIRASYIPPEKQQFNYFRTSVKRIRNKSGKFVWVSAKTASIQQKIKMHNNWSEENYQKRTKKQLGKLKKMGEKYAHLGIDINKIIVQPKILTGNKKKQLEISKADAENEESTVSNFKTLKRRPSIKDVSSNKESTKKSKKAVSLEALLSNTFEDDSDDEDYAPNNDSDCDDGSEESSDEETYNLSIDSDKEDDQNNSENESEVEVIPSLPKKFNKLVKSSKVDRIDQILRRKPHVGGINKLNKKPKKQPVVAAKKKSILQISAAKELAKPLSKIKSKMGRSLKVKTSIKLK